ncbi:hypothetical protein VTO73DRAFT_13514 [Trametes versicolor]
MPLDILVKIFSWTHPRDLLNLARTTTAFQNFLMSRNTAGSLWKKARETAEDLPSYLSEPAYANLMFFPHCHNCLKPNVQTVIFEFSVCYCPACKKKLVLSRETVMVDGFFEKGKRRSGCRDDVLNSIFVGKGAKEVEYFHTPEVISFLEACGEIAEGDRDARRDRAKRIAAHVVLVKQTCPQLYAWKDAQTQARADAIESTRSQQFSDILDRLREEGWADEIDAMDQNARDTLYRLRPYARKAAELTNRGMSIQSLFWHSILTQTTRQHGRTYGTPHTPPWKTFKGLVQALADGRPPGWRHTAEADMEPLLVDFALAPEVREIAEAPDFASNPGVPRWPVDDVRAIFQCMAQRWRHERKTDLIAMLKSAMPELEDVHDPLTLAVAVLSCCRPGCERKVPLRWPGVLAHPCTRLSALPTDSDKDVYMSALRDLDSFERPHSLGYLKVDSKTVHNLCAVMEAYGLDPLQTTQESLDDVKGRLQCVKCVTKREDGRKFEAFDWLRAVSLEHNPGGQWSDRCGLSSFCITTIPPTTFTVFRVA